jgi:cyclophilin family peptidyl-prolyl cis-trans isomerase
MPRLVAALVLTLVLTTPALAREFAVIATSYGDIKVELYADKAPVTVANFLRYAEKGHYDGTIFHRVIRNFMIQGGGLTAELLPKPTDPPIRNEAGNGLKNLRGTIAMARTGVVDSATSQFFINTVDNPPLDHRDDTSASFGYAVFGKVVAGMDVVDKIGNAPTGMRNRFRDVPVETVVIKSVRRVDK